MKKHTLHGEGRASVQVWLYPAEASGYAITFIAPQGGVLFRLATCDYSIEETLRTLREAVTKLEKQQEANPDGR